MRKIFLRQQFVLTLELDDCPAQTEEHIRLALLDLAEKLTSGEYLPYHPEVNMQQTSVGYEPIRKAS